MPHELAFSGTVQIVMATGAGALALVIGAIRIYFSLGAEDRVAFLNVARHPLRTIFVEDEADEEDGF